MSRSNFHLGSRWIWAGIVLCLACGCHAHRAEKCCPTDLSDTYGPFSSEAVRRLPCGPDYYNFGVKPTVWRCGPTDHPPSPAPCADECNWELEKRRTLTPIEMPQGDEYYETVPSSDLPPPLMIESNG